VVDVLERAPVKGGGGGRVGPAVRRKDGLARPWIFRQRTYLCNTLRWQLYGGSLCLFLSLSLSFSPTHTTAAAPPGLPPSSARINTAAVRIRPIIYYVWAFSSCLEGIYGASENDGGSGKERRQEAEAFSSQPSPPPPLPPSRHPRSRLSARHPPENSPPPISTLHLSRPPPTYLPIYPPVQ